MRMLDKIAWAKTGKCPDCKIVEKSEYNDVQICAAHKDNLGRDPKHVFIEDEELSEEWRDVGPWRSFRLDANGDTLAALLEEATVTAVDQDGGEMYTDGLYDTSSVEEAEILIARAFLASRGYKTIREEKKS